MPSTMLDNPNWKKTKNKCPMCSLFLLSIINDDGNVLIWCGEGQCKSIGANEGATGKNEDEAYNKLLQKLQLA